LNSGHDLASWNEAPAVAHTVSKQRDDFASGQVRVKVSGDLKEPAVNAFARSRRGRKQFFQEWRQRRRVHHPSVEASGVVGWIGRAGPRR